MHRKDLGVSLFALLAAAALAAGGAASAGAAMATTTWDGTIQSVAGGTVVLTTAAGQKTVKTTPSTTVLSRTPAQLSDIKPGDFVGVDAKKAPNGALTAVTIGIVPPELKARARQGQFPMASGDTMTNATVTQTVTQVSGRSLTLTYEGTSWKIAVPASTSIHKLTVTKLAALMPKMHATARGTANADGSLTATSITVDQAAMMH